MISNSLCIFSIQDALACAVADEMQKIYRNELGPEPIPLIVPGEAVNEEEVSFLCYFLARALALADTLQAMFCYTWYKYALKIHLSQMYLLEADEADSGSDVENENLVEDGNTDLEKR